MTFTSAVTGGSGSLAYGIEYDPTPPTGTPGTPVTTNKYAPVAGKDFKAPWDMVKPEYMRATRMTMASMERAKISPQGTVDFLLNPALGVADFVFAGLGASTSLALVSATTTAANTTTNGVTTLTVTGSFVPGAILQIGTGATMEMRTVLSYSAGSLTVSGLVANATAASGLTVKQVAQTKYANSLLSSANANLLPTLTIEDVHGKSQWSWLYPGMYVDSLDFALSKDKHTVQAKTVGIAEPLWYNAGGTGGASGTTAVYAPNATDEANALRPLTSIDASIVAFGDPDATGTSSVRAALGVQDVKLSFKNALIKESAFNNSTAYLYFPGDKATCDATYTEISTSLRPDVWYDAIKASVGSAFTAAAMKNYGTSGTPDVGGVSLYIPYGRYETADVSTKIGSVDTWSKKFTALASGGSNDYLQVFIAKP